MEECSSSVSISTDMSVSQLLFQAASLIPIWQYFVGVSFIFLIFVYNFFELHFLEDVLNGFRGNQVRLLYNSCSEMYQGVVSKCPTLHGRYLPTLWLSSPHLQTAFLTFFGRPPIFTYTRQLFNMLDGGTIALDWLPADVPHGLSDTKLIPKDETTPIVVVIPGLTSDSSAAYIKHLVFKLAIRGWNVVVSNHRGLGGISLTSDRFYNAGWTEDLRKVVEYLHKEYPRAPLFAVGTSIGANLLVKYLGEDGNNTYISGAVAICSPWDLLIGDRFISRRLVQRFYGKALTIGLQGYAQIHESIYSRLADWEGITKARSIRDFDHYATCLVGKFETVDTYYRHCSSASFVRNVSVPLLCISAMDDPLCTREAIPWDECRANKNVVLATTAHGGHLAFFEGITANGLWWVRAVDEFLSVLHSSPFMHKPTMNSSPHCMPEPSIDQGPYVTFMEDGMVSAVDEQTSNDMMEILPDGENKRAELEQNSEVESEGALSCDTMEPSKLEDSSSKHAAAPVTKRIDQLSRQTQRSMWLLAYIAVITSWPLIGSALALVFKRKLRNVIPRAWLGK